MSENKTADNLEKLRFMVIADLAKDFIEDALVETSCLQRFATDDITIRVRQMVWGQRIGEQITIKYPANWKEAVKEHFAPQWYLEKHPVRYSVTEINLAELYPKWRPDTERVIVNMSDMVDLNRTKGINYNYQ